MKLLQTLSKTKTIGFKTIQSQRFANNFFPHKFCAFPPPNILVWLRALCLLLKDEYSFTSSPGGSANPDLASASIGYENRPPHRQIL